MEEREMANSEGGSEQEDSLGIAVADLVENVIANSLKIAEDVANDAARVARSAGQFLRDLRDL